MTEPLTKRYRPKTFQEVWGQPDAVRLLSGIVKHKLRGFNILLHGDVGSGKTTLARILGRALNCVEIDDHGSPCNRCENCLNEGQYISEYDVPGDGPDAENLARWWSENDHPPTQSGTRLMFLDEIQESHAKAQAGLLVRLENPVEGVVVCVATSERHRLSQAFDSRFIDIRISGLSVGDAVSLLEAIATKENIAYERDAFYLLASAKRCQPRDLISGLEQLASIARPVNVELVDRVFGLGWRHLLSAYCVALAEGDSGKQGERWSAWNERPSEKIDLIKCFLTQVFFANVVGQETKIDPLMFAMVEQRNEVVSQFCHRLGVPNARYLLSSFEKMLGFWADFPRSDDADGELRRALFEHLVNFRLPVDVKNGLQPESKLVSPQIEKQSVNERIGGDVEACGAADGYLESEDTEELLNRVSAFTQHTGALFNFSVDFIPSLAASEREESALLRIQTFVDSLSEWAGGDGFTGVSFVAVIERNGDICVRIVGNAQFTRSGRSKADFQAWLVDCSSASGASISCMFADSKDQIGFHWSEVKHLCAGVQAKAGTDDIRKRLGIPRQLWRDPGPVSSAPILFYGVLTRACLEKASADGMVFEPAMKLDSKTRLRVDGWEQAAHRKRLVEIERRNTQLAHLRHRHQGSPALISREESNLRETWRRNPFSFCRPGSQ